MGDIRSFVAVDLGAPMKAQLATIQRELKAGTPPGSVRWVRPEAVHLTLKFLGNVPGARIEEIVTALRQASGSVTAFSFRVVDAGCFPNVSRPRVVWAGVEDGAGALRALQKAVEKALTPLGFEPESRPFKPHLTLGRTQRRASAADVRAIGERVRTLDVGVLGEVEVREIVLMRSDLSPEGARYTPLAHIPFGGAEP